MADHFEETPMTPEQRRALVRLAKEAAVARVKAERQLKQRAIEHALRNDQFLRAAHGYEQRRGEA